ncbi:hypothetical protein BJ322DRAFT_1069956 [Thelephora terrestris]|uniref:Uncharacterized protein n=1 Tax=Thelephora terrestris TaxID=56493 RepID=A0A9P6HDC3_9AGAM|nr:hypothetical protein BJ322DRAFT_1069956 [Thelephora terrestris]
MYAHFGRSSPMLRYCLTHIRSIASFLLIMFITFLPPLPGSCARSLIAIVALSFPHTNSWIALWISFCTVSGIPWALVRNCVFPPATICTIRRLPSKVGYRASHRLKSFLIVSTIFFHGSSGFSLFPTHAPRILVASLSPAMWIDVGTLSPATFITLVSARVWRYSAVPIGIISVFSTLNFAPDTSHHSSSMPIRSDRLSCSVRTTVVSSAKRDTFTFSLRLGTSIPWMCDALMFAASGSMLRSNRMHDMGSPCLTPLDTRKGSLIIPFMITDVGASR